MPVPPFPLFDHPFRPDATSAPAEPEEWFSPQSLRRLALMLAVYCVRNTVIETYHSNGQLSQSDMKAFNVEVGDKLYTALSLLFDPQFEPHRGEFLELLAKNYPTGWQTPELDQGLLRALELPPRQ